MDRRRLLLGMGALAVTPVASAGGECQKGVCSVRVQRDVEMEFAQAEHAERWCWAACASMIFRHVGTPVNQTRIVAEAYGRIDNMPTQRHHIVSMLQRTWRADTTGKKFRGRAGLIDLETASDHLKNDRPVIIGILDHPAVLIAMDYRVKPSWSIDRVVVLDPYPYAEVGKTPPAYEGGEGRRVLTQGKDFSSVSLLAAVV